MKASKSITSPAAIEAIDLVAARDRDHQKTITVTANHGVAGAFQESDQLAIERCAVFDIDGVYAFTIGGLLQYRRISLRVADGMLNVESSDGRGASEIMPRMVFESNVQVRGRVVGAMSFMKL